MAKSGFLFILLLTFLVGSIIISQIFGFVLEAYFEERRRRK